MPSPHWPLPQRHSRIIAPKGKKKKKNKKNQFLFIPLKKAHRKK
jgi:hypothetical protein